MRWLAYVTAVFGALPFAVFGVSWALGYLPSRAIWDASGENHGPWRWALEGWLVGYPLVALVAVTLITGIVLALVRNKLKPIGHALILIVLQLVLMVGQFNILFWTID